MLYQFNSDMLPDTYFHPGDLKYIVPGNEGRWLDPRRTPIRILAVKPASGFFIVEILDFEDKGARWEVQLESVDASLRKEAPKRAKPTAHCTRRQSHAWTDSLRLQRNLRRRAASEATIESLRAEIRAWMESESAFLRSATTLDLSGQTGNPALWTHLKRYMTEKGLWDIEEAFAEQYVRNPNSGELVKGHAIVLAELGLVT